MVFPHATLYKYWQWVLKINSKKKKKNFWLCVYLMWRSSRSICKIRSICEVLYKSTTLWTLSSPTVLLSDTLLPPSDWVYHDDNEQENATCCISTPHHGNRGQTTGFKLLVTRVSSISRQVKASLWFYSQPWGSTRSLFEFVDSVVLRDYVFVQVNEWIVSMFINEKYIAQNAF